MKRSVIIAVIFDVLLWLTLGCVAVLLAYNALGVRPYNRGFFCDDQTISYPYKADTVSDGMAALLCVVVPGIFMVGIEGAHVYFSKIRKAKGTSSFCLKYITYIYKTVGAFLMGAAGTLLVSEVVKVLGGRLRPHFLAVCDPDYTQITCANGYILESHCQGTDTKKLIDARKSFPSGHASLAGYGLLYLVVYLHVRFIWRRSRLLVPVMQLGAICLACWVAVSRVSDYKHHWSDVVCGAILGALGCIFTYKCISCLPEQLRRNGGEPLLPVKDPTPRSSTSSPHGAIEMNSTVSVRASAGP